VYGLQLGGLAVSFLIMPRTARKAPGGLVYHVLNRSVASFVFMRSGKDRDAFLRVLAEACERWPGVRVLGWCVMSTHWHLVLWPKRDGEMKLFMHWLTLTHAARWRTSRRSVGQGPVYQGRYKSFPVESDEHCLTVLRYVERNALRARQVKRAEDWAWSSLATRLDPRSEADAPLKRCLVDGPVTLRADWSQRVNLPQTPAEEAALATSLHRGRPFGSEKFQTRTAARLGLASCFRPPGRPPKAKKRAVGK
jgi:putative transposase